MGKKKLPIAGLAPVPDHRLRIVQMASTFLNQEKKAADEQRNREGDPEA
jgi:hypothetical protein